MSTVVISGYYGYGNAGDEALLRAIIEALSRINPNIKIIVLSRKPDQTKETYGVEAVQRYNPIAIISAILRSKVVISGGGSLLQDVTGPFTIPYYLLVVLMGKILGRKVMFYAQGIGPVNSKLGKFLIRKIVDRVHLITLRDNASALKLREIGITNPPIIVTGDPVFGLFPGSQLEDSALFNKEAVLCLRPWDSLPGLEEAVFELSRHLLTLGWKITLLPLHHKEDYIFVKDFSDRLRKVEGQAASRNVQLISGTQTIDEILGEISKASILIGVRLHALIFATLLGKPVIGIAYDPKVVEFLKEIKRPAFGANVELVEDSLIQEADRIIQNYESECKHAKQCASQLRSKAEENAVWVSRLLEK